MRTGPFIDSASPGYGHRRPLKPADRHVEGVVEMMLDATRHYNRSLTSERSVRMARAAFPTGRSGMTKISMGAWRD